MRINDSIKIVARNLSRSRTRTILTSVGVLIGVAAIVTLISITMALNRSVVEQIESAGDIKVVTVFPTSFRFGGMGPMNRGASNTQTNKILDKESLKELEKIDGVVAVTPIYEYSNAKLVYGKYYTIKNLTGIKVEKIEDIVGELEKGRYLTKSDKGAVIIGSKVKDGFLDSNTNEAVTFDPYGKTLKLTVEKIENNKIEKKIYQFRVVGVLKEKGSQDDYTIYVPIDSVIEIREWITGSKLNLDTNGYSRAIVKVKDVNSVNNVTNKIQEMGFTAISIQTIINSISNVFLILQFILGGIAGISLIVAGVGIVNTMTMSIYERTRQIGIMKAIGASNGDILFMFLLEASSLGFIGGVGGVILSFLLNSIITFVARFLVQGVNLRVTTPFYLIILAILFATIVGMIAGYFPSKRAANLSPVEALRYE